MCLKWARARRRAVEAGGAAGARLRLPAMRWNGIGFVEAPFAPFVETGVAARDASPLEPLLFGGYAGGLHPRGRGLSRRGLPGERRRPPLRPCGPTSARDRGPAAVGLLPAPCGSPGNRALKNRRGGSAGHDGPVRRARTPAALPRGCSRIGHAALRDRPRQPLGRLCRMRHAPPGNGATRDGPGARQPPPRASRTTDISPWRNGAPFDHRVWHRSISARRASSGRGWERAGGPTRLVATHRLPALRRADRIVVLRAGRGGPGGRAAKQRDAAQRQPGLG